MAPTHSLEALKAANQSRAQEDKQASERQKDCLVLVVDHLRSCGYHDVVTQLLKDAPFLERHEMADNVSLAQIVREYEEIKEIKFGRKPTFSKRVNNENETGNGNSNAAGARKKQAAAARRRLSQQYGASNTSAAESGVLKSVRGRLEGEGGANGPNTKLDSTSGDDTIDDTQPLSVQGSEVKHGHRTRQSDNDTHPEERVLKPLPSFGGDIELRSLASTIQRDIIQSSTGVSWDDIIELHEAKRLMKESVVTPLKYPQLFTGLLSPWCGVLLYGPPGTGKTMLAKAVAAQSRTTFFNISASSIVSKFRGDSEKLVRVLFELARYHAPSTIFLDEIDAIMGHRSSSGGAGGGEGGSTAHEGSRRMTTELLIQMDGLSRGSEHVFVLAASNLPWDLDPALLRRLEKRVFVPLPDEAARKEMLEAHFSALPSSHACRESDFARCAEATAGYSGADIKLLCKEAAMRPVRRILKELEEAEVWAKDGRRTSSSLKPSQPAAAPDVAQMMKRNPVTPDDLEASLKCTNRSSGSQLCDRYTRWTEDFGSI